MLNPPHLFGGRIMLNPPRIVAGFRPLRILRLIGVTDTQGPGFVSGSAAMALTTSATAFRARRAGSSAAMAIEAVAQARRLRHGAGTAEIRIEASARGRRMKLVWGIEPWGVMPWSGRREID